VSPANPRASPNALCTTRQLAFAAVQLCSAGVGDETVFTAVADRLVALAEGAAPGRKTSDPGMWINTEVSAFVFCLFCFCFVFLVFGLFFVFVFCLLHLSSVGTS
jgi:hypothetical protein